MRGRPRRRRAVAAPRVPSRGGALSGCARAPRVGRRRPPAAVLRARRRRPGRAPRLDGDARRAADGRDRPGPQPAARRGCESHRRPRRSGRFLSSECAYEPGLERLLARHGLGTSRDQSAPSASGCAAPVTARTGRSPSRSTGGGGGCGRPRLSLGSVYADFHRKSLRLRARGRSSAAPMTRTPRGACSRAGARFRRRGAAPRAILERARRAGLIVSRRHRVARPLVVGGTACWRVVRSRERGSSGQLGEGRRPPPASRGRCAVELGRGQGPEPWDSPAVADMAGQLDASAARPARPAKGCGGGAGARGTRLLAVQGATGRSSTGAARRRYPGSGRRSLPSCSRHKLRSTDDLGCATCARPEPHPPVSPSRSRAL